jgi:hypothetical protein
VEGKFMTNDLVSGLRKLIEDQNNREHECRKFLQYARETLVTDTVKEFVYVEKERRGASGDSDYIISCKVSDAMGIESVKAYVWELKAPQCFIFEKDTESRLRPTSDLVQAENQLMHYHHEYKDTADFRHEFGVTHPDNVLFGGIIIGCRKTRVRGNYEESKESKLFEKALAIRKRYIYDQNQIRILTWDYILDFLKPSGPLQAEPVYIGSGELQPQLLDPGHITFTTSG